MNSNKKLVNEIIKSLETEPSNWNFRDYTVDNDQWGISLWIKNAPILDLDLYKPTKIKFSLLNRYRIYRALSECRAIQMLNLKHR